jgi:hypothetical protein
MNSNYKKVWAKFPEFQCEEGVLAPRDILLNLPDTRKYSLTDSVSYPDPDGSGSSS